MIIEILETMITYLSGISVLSELYCGEEIQCHHQKNLNKHSMIFRLAMM